MMAVAGKGKTDKNGRHDLGLGAEGALVMVSRLGKAFLQCRKEGGGQAEFSGIVCMEVK